LCKLCVVVTTTNHDVVVILPLKIWLSFYIYFISQLFLSFFFYHITNFATIFV